MFFSRMHNFSHSFSSLPQIVIFVLTPVYWKVKVKIPCNCPKDPEGGRGIALLFLDLSARRGGWSAPCLNRLPPGKTR
jgi:hypothetical protein